MSILFLQMHESKFKKGPPHCGLHSRSPYKSDWASVYTSAAAYNNIMLYRTKRLVNELKQLTESNDDYRFSVYGHISLAPCRIERAAADRSHNYSTMTNQ